MEMPPSLISAHSRGRFGGAWVRLGVDSASEPLIGEIMRTWMAWALIEPEGPIHRVYFDDPTESLGSLIAMGWKVIRVSIEEQ